MNSSRCGLNSAISEIHISLPMAVSCHTLLATFLELCRIHSQTTLFKELTHSHHAMPPLARPAPKRASRKEKLTWTSAARAVARHVGHVRVPTRTIKVMHSPQKVCPQGSTLGTLAGIAYSWKQIKHLMAKGLGSDELLE